MAFFFLHFMLGSNLPLTYNQTGNRKATLKNLLRYNEKHNLPYETQNLILAACSKKCSRTDVACNVSQKNPKNLIFNSIDVAHKNLQKESTINAIHCNR